MQKSAVFGITKSGRARRFKYPCKDGTERKPPFGFCNSYLQKMRELCEVLNPKETSIKEKTQIELVKKIQRLFKAKLHKKANATKIQRFFRAKMTRRKPPPSPLKATILKASPSPSPDRSPLKAATTLKASSSPSPYRSPSRSPLKATTSKASPAPSPYRSPPKTLKASTAKTPDFLKDLEGDFDKFLGNFYNELARDRVKGKALDLELDELSPQIKRQTL